MKASELIKRLEALVAEHGDIDVIIPCTEVSLEDLRWTKNLAAVKDLLKPRFSEQSAYRIVTAGSQHGEPVFMIAVNGDDFDG